MYYIFVEELAWAGTCTYQADLQYIAEFETEKEAVEYCDNNKEAFYVVADNYYEAEKIAKS